MKNNKVVLIVFSLIVLIIVMYFLSKNTNRVSNIGNTASVVDSQDTDNLDDYLNNPTTNSVTTKENLVNSNNIRN